MVYRSANGLLGGLSGTSLIVQSIGRRLPVRELLLFRKEADDGSRVGFGVSSQDIHWVSSYDITPKETVSPPVIYGLCDGHLGTNAARFLASQLETVFVNGRNDA